MEPKPFSIKSPEEVASAYGGNKQKIAQAIQMGALDPTSGLLAGMFIDRMRSAQAMEQAPQQTVAQQVLAPSAPPAPPAGLGAIGPQGGAMPPAPPPPPAGLGAMPPVGMAAGGMTELPASYGLDSLPIPDNMYNEESFAGGGIVAFAGGRKVDARAEQIKALMAVATDPDSSPEDRMAARVALNKLEGMGPGRTPGPGLADALAFTREDLNNLTPQAEASIYSPAAGGFKGGDLSVYAPDAPPRAADSIYSPSGTGSAKGISLSDLSRLVPRSPQIAGDSIYSPSGTGSAKDISLSDLSRLVPRSPQIAGDSIYSPSGGGMSLPIRSSQSATGADGLTADYSLEADYPRVNAGPNKGKTLAELTAVARAANEASGQVPFKGLGRALLPFPERQALEARERAEAQARPVTPSNAKSDLGRVNMGGYDPNRSSPEAQLAAILGRSPTPEATELDALLGRTETAPVRADTAPTRIPGAGRRTGAGAATTRPTSSTAPAAGTTPEMSDEEFKAKARRDYEEAAKLPAPKGTTAEEKAARKNEDLWSSLAQIGFGMAAGESPNFLTNVGKATAAAVPGMQEALKERRADTKEELKQRYAYELAQAGVKGDAYKFSMDRFDKLEDNRQRKSTLAETIRHNQAMEKLQGQQIAQAGSTGTERLMADYLAATPEKRAGMEQFFRAQSAFGEGKLTLAQQAAITKAYENVDDKYKDQLFRLSVGKKNAAALADLQRRIAQEKQAEAFRITGGGGTEKDPLGLLGGQ